MNIPLQDFFRNPEKTAYTLSPDGEHFAFLQPWESRLNIHVQNIHSDQALRLTDATERDIRAFFWVNNTTLAYLQDTNGDENYRLYAIDIEKQNERCLTPADKIKVFIVDKLEDNPQELLIAMNQRDPRLHDVYRLNVDTKELQLVAENPGNISGWLTDHEGKVRAATATDGVNSSLLYRENEDETFQTVITTNFKESLAPLYFTFDNQYLYVESNIGRDKSAIIKYDPRTKEELEVIYQHPEVDVSSLMVSKKRKIITAVMFTTWKSEYHFFDEQTKLVQQKLEQALPGYEVRRTSSDKQENKYIVRTYSDKSLGSYYLYDVAKDDLVKLSDVSPWIDENLMADMKPISYTSRDGLTIHGYLTIPRGASPENLPVVVNPHGGPWYRDVWCFNQEVQFLAHQGYAVLQMNFRGSTGYGREFWQASFKQWGQKMQDDISDGVQWLIDEEIADPKKIAIYGGSYGGYAVLAGLAFTPDLYVCGIDFVGVSNLFTFMKTIPPYWEPYLDMMYEMVGHPEQDQDMMKAASPVYHVDKIKSPLFIAQGKTDPRVNIDESNQMVEALKQRGIDVPYMVKDNEGHGFSNEENRFDFYRAMQEFLAKYLKS